MSRVLSMRLQDQQLVRLKRYARTLGKTPSEVSALLIEEQLRENEFAFVEFRPSPVGRQAYMKGSRLTVWWVVYTAKQLEMSAERVAAHFDRPVEWVRAALNYYESYPAEIDLAIEDHLAFDFEALKRAFPNVQVIEVPAEVPDGAQG